MAEAGGAHPVYGRRQRSLQHLLCTPSSQRLILYVLVIEEKAARARPPANFIASTGAGYVSPKDGDYARAEAMGLRVVLMLVEAFGGLGPALADQS